jgi:hypothetical protein
MTRVAIPDLAACAARVIAWSPTGRAEFPYAAEIEGKRWSVRVNDFPAEPIYTLFIGDRPIGDLEAWPKAWRRPG